MRSSVMAAAALVGRLLLAAIFLHEAWSKFAAYPAALAYMQAFGVPGQLLPLAIAVELGCGLLILCGYHTRAAALVLAGFCLATAVLFHGKFGDRNQLLHFEKDLAIAGGLLVLFAHGAGAWSLDALRSVVTAASPQVSGHRSGPDLAAHSNSATAALEPFGIPRD